MNSNQNLKVTIGIPAYNEGRNIKSLLEQILSQKRIGWDLAEILVYCDGCTDNTIKEARKVKNDLVHIVADSRRRGKTFRLRQMFETFSGDVLVMFDGDISILSKQTVSTLIIPFSNKNVMLVGGNSKPFSPQTFIEKAVYSTFIVFYDSRKKVKDGNNIFGATGSIMAIRQKLARNISLPKIVNEDAFIYLYCIKEGYKFEYVDGAQVYYRLPKNFKDYIKQLFRSAPQAVDSELSKYFGNLVKAEFERPLKVYLKSIAKAFLRYPLEASVIVAINLLARPLNRIVIRNYNLAWFTAQSTH